MDTLTREPEVEESDPGMIVIRKDTVTEAIVNKAIKLMEMRGASEAAAYLRYNKVKMDVALRVLSRPLERRSPR